MKIEFFVILVTFSVFCTGVFVPPRPNYRKHAIKKECTLGPSYWCQNITLASNCHAVKHCIQTVWIHKKLPPDNSNVCQTCLDMVKQARDQLESNETQEMIKQVFEGSCKLLLIKPVVELCDKVADDYIPDLIDTLASEMNPQVVCSVAGLCNNEKLTAMMGDSGQVAKTEDSCEGCHTVIGIMEKKFNQLSRDEILERFLEICGEMGSFSDGCSNIIVTYFNEIYQHLKDNFNANDVCLMSGECSAQFHKHEIEITPISHIGYIPVVKQDNLPCDLCQQLVDHLRDLLVANTTEEEFRLVLQGLCRQTQGFKDECLSLVNEYYGVVYNFLLTELNASAVCAMAGICPNNKMISPPIMPLLPVETTSKVLEITQHRVNVAEDGAGVRAVGDSVKIMENSPEMAQLPIDLLMPPHTQVLYNKELCALCEYMMNFLQQTITSPSSEEEIKDALDKVCTKLPSSIQSSCVDFVGTYEPAFIAILAQEIDPSQTCPLLKVCPGANIKDVEVFMHAQNTNGNCPLCLFAVTRLEEMIKNGKTKENIKDALDKLCSHLSSNLAEECDDFVNTYTDELIDMLLADFTPQEVCVNLKICNGSKAEDFGEFSVGDIETNMIPDNTVNGLAVDNKGKHLEKADNECVLCEFVMKEVQDQLKNNKTEDEIKKIVYKVCSIMPKSINSQCDDFIEKYADIIIQLLIQATTPNEICHMIGLCKSAMEAVQVEIFDCIMCDAITNVMEKIISNPKVDHEISHIFKKTCLAFPKHQKEKCEEFIEKYGKTIFDLLLLATDKGLICKQIGLCSNEVARLKRQELLGSEHCTWGPGYWCQNEANARECGEGALEHCQKKVWQN